MKIFSILVIIISIIFVIIANILRKKYGEKKITVENTKPYPPEGYNPPEIAFLYNGFTKYEHVNSLIIYLANKGYLKVEETQGNDLYSTSKDYRVTKIKEYDGSNENEKLFLKEIFQYGLNSFAVSFTNLYGSIGVTSDEIKKNLKLENKKKIFEPLMSGIAKWVMAMIAIIIILLIIVTAVVNSKIYLLTDIIGIVCIVMLAYCAKKMVLRTTYGNEILLEIESFKKFIETAEKEELQDLVNKNPEYFYDILPFAIALGNSNIWIEKFEEIETQIPNWYYSLNTFSMKDLKAFVDVLKTIK